MSVKCLPLQSGLDEKDQGLFQNGRNTRNVEENVALNNMIAIFKKVGVTHYVYSIYHFQIVIKIREGANKFLI